jgi:adenylate cyclase
MTLDMNDKRSVDVGNVWWFWFTTNAFAVDKRLRHILRVLPRDPRCKFCNAPFQGVGGAVVRILFGKRRSDLNPRYCNLCEVASREFPGGAEVPMSMLFIDVRGSTALSEKMSPTEFSQVINRFYKEATKIIIDEDGLVEKLAGDSVAAFWGAGFAGTDYVARTVRVAQNLLRAMDRQNIPVGIGVHCGIAYFGAMGAADGLTEISAIGDEVNLAARLASKAAPGEIILSEQAVRAAGIDDTKLESRSLDLKGISEPVNARVMGGS